MTEMTEDRPEIADLHLPQLRVRPPAGWVNDPNGPVRWGNRWHLFFQHNPAAPIHADICWGHASSPDLVHWYDEPVALAPTPGSPDASGCWSGCVVADEGRAVAIYTAAAGGPETAVIAIAHAADDDLLRWDKSVVPAAEAPPGLPLLGFRDPFIFLHEGRRLAVVGAGLQPRGRGVVLLFACDDLTAWQYLGILIDSSDAVAATHAAADIWECPQLVRMGDRWALILSLVTEAHLGRVAYLVGDLVSEGDGFRFRAAHGGLVDHGHAFYAPAVLSSAGRALLWGWVPEDRPEEDVRDAGWAGALTVTRELSLSATATLRSRPVQGLDALLDADAAVPIGPGEDLLLPPQPTDVLVRIDPRPGDGFTLRIDELELELDFARSQATLRSVPHDRFRRGWVTSAGFDRDDLDAAEHEVRIIVDGSVVEIFVGGGPAFTERSYPAGGHTLGLTSSSSTGVEVTLRRVLSAPPSHQSSDTTPS